MTFKTTLESNYDISKDILKAIEDLRFGSGFGSIEIVVHDGRVTQIEKREKLRFPLEKIKKESIGLGLAK
jgi:hypothetical protein